MQSIVNRDPPKLRSGSNEVKNFVECCLRKTPEERKTTKELLNHPFITQIGKGDKERDEFIKMLRIMKKSSLQSLIKGLPSEN
jgi:serine/threonine protein kinase